METEITVFLVDKEEESTVSIFGITYMIIWLIVLNLTPLLISPHGGKEYNSFPQWKNALSGAPSPVGEGWDGGATYYLKT